jgi:hypothetical protein
LNQPHSWLRFGENHRLQILVIEPLFEEANRCRRLIAQIMRGLDVQGIGSTLADLPGTGECPADIADVRLDDWRTAVSSYEAAFVASFRGGALVDDAGDERDIWRFAPESGARIVRDLKRTALTSSNATSLAGHALSDAFLADLEAALPASVTGVRTVRLESDPQDAEIKLTGTPLWRRAEPGEDGELAAALVADLAARVKQCAAL